MRIRERLGSNPPNPRQGDPCSPSCEGSVELGATPKPRQGDPCSPLAGGEAAVAGDLLVGFGEGGAPGASGFFGYDVYGDVSLEGGFLYVVVLGLDMEHPALVVAGHDHVDGTEGGVHLGYVLV